MKTITLELSDEDYSTVEAAICTHYGYEEVSVTNSIKMENGRATPSRIETPNPLSKEQFVVECIIQHTKEIVKTEVLKQKRQEAVVEVDDALSNLTITHK